MEFPFPLSTPGEDDKGNVTLFLARDAHGGFKELWKGQEHGSLDVLI